MFKNFSKSDTTEIHREDMNFGAFCASIQISINK